MTKTIVDTDQGCSYAVRVESRAVELEDRFASIATQRAAYAGTKATTQVIELDQEKILIRDKLNVARAAIRLCEVCGGDPSSLSPEDRQRPCAAALVLINEAMKV